MGAWARYLVALLIGLHGLVYLNAARGVLPVFAGWKRSSWLLSAAVRASSPSSTARHFFCCGPNGERASQLARRAFALRGGAVHADAIFTGPGVPREQHAQVR